MQCYRLSLSVRPFIYVACQYFKVCEAFEMSVLFYARFLVGILFVGMQ